MRGGGGGGGGGGSGGAVLSRHDSTLIAREVLYRAALHTARAVPLLRMVGATWREVHVPRVMPQKDVVAPREHRCGAPTGHGLAATRNPCNVVCCPSVRAWVQSAAAAGGGAADDDDDHGLYVHLCFETPGCDDAAVHSGECAAEWVRAPQYDVAERSVAVCLTTGAWHLCRRGTLLKETSHASMHDTPTCPAYVDTENVEGNNVCVMTGIVLQTRCTATLEDMRRWVAGTSMMGKSDSILAGMLQSSSGCNADNAESRVHNSGGTTIRRHGAMSAPHNADISVKVSRYQRAHEISTRARAIGTGTRSGGGSSGGGALPARRLPLVSPTPSRTLSSARVALTSQRAVAVAQPPAVIQAHPSTVSMLRMAAMHSERRTAAAAEVAEAGSPAPPPSLVGTLDHVVALSSAQQQQRKRSRRGGDRNSPRTQAAAAPSSRSEHTTTFFHGNTSIVTVHQLDVSFVVKCLTSDERTERDYARVAERNAAALASLRCVAAESSAAGMRMSVPEMLRVLYRLANGTVSVEPFVAPRDARLGAVMHSYMQRLVLRFWHSLTSSAGGRDTILAPPFNGDFRVCVLPIIGLLSRGVDVECPDAVLRATGCSARRWIVKRDEMARALMVNDRPTLEALGLSTTWDTVSVTLAAAITRPLYDADVCENAGLWLTTFNRLCVDGDTVAQQHDEWMLEINLLPRMLRGGGGGGGGGGGAKAPPATSAMVEKACPPVRLVALGMRGSPGVSWKPQDQQDDV